LPYNIKTTKALATPISKTLPKLFFPMAAPDFDGPVEPPDPAVPILVLVAVILLVAVRGLPVACVPVGLVAIAVPVANPVATPVAVPVAVPIWVLLGERLIDVIPVPAHAWLKSLMAPCAFPWGSLPLTLTRQSIQAATSSPLVFVHRQVG